jgi:hypothetical protein
MKVAAIALFTSKHTPSTAQKQSFKPYLVHFDAYLATEVQKMSSFLAVVALSLTWWTKGQLMVPKEDQGRGYESKWGFHETVRLP